MLAGFWACINAIAHLGTWLYGELRALPPELKVGFVASMAAMMAVWICAFGAAWLWVELYAREVGDDGER